MALKSLKPFGRASSPARGEADPFSLMRREMERLLDHFAADWPERFRGLPTQAGGFLSPKVDIAESEKGLEITVDLPGIDQKDIQLGLADGILTLEARHEEEKEEKDEKKQYHLVERSHGSFLRRFTIPFEPDAEKIQASFEKGVLHVVVPRSASAEQQVRKIAINNG